MSLVPPRSAENATVVPSGENDGDSGSSTNRIGSLTSILRFVTFWTMSARSFSVRTK